MGRNKYPEVTENRILETSMRLFIKKGYEQTTLQDVADAMGMTRGAIYGHFKNKEHMVDAVTTYMFNKAVPMQQIIEDKDLTALEKMRKLFVASISSGEQQKVVWALSKTFYNNPKLVADYLSNATEDVADIYLALIQQGAEDGSITVEEPKIAAELLSLLLELWLSPLVFKSSKDELKKKWKYSARILENIGLPVIDDVLSQAFEKMLTQLPA